MVKKAAFGIAVAGMMFANVASARDLRPSAVNLSPAAVQSINALPAPTKLRVNKRNNLAPLVVVAIVVVVAGAAGGIAAASSGDSSSPS
jgi:hypothetical protein